MIIGISGRMGSGKNTVCDIIQDLCKKHNGPNFEQKAFAGKLKTIASLLTGVPVEMWEDQEFKKKTFKQLVEEGYISQELLNTLTKT
jgi:dephospho-CoA kinase